MLLNYGKVTLKVYTLMNMICNYNYYVSNKIVKFDIHI